jgi:hypothetical protein
VKYGKLQVNFVVCCWQNSAESGFLKLKINYMNWRYFCQLYLLRVGDAAVLAIFSGQNLPVNTPYLCGFNLLFYVIENAYSCE